MVLQDGIETKTNLQIMFYWHKNLQAIFRNMFNNAMILHTISG